MDVATWMKHVSQYSNLQLPEADREAVNALLIKLRIEGQRISRRLANRPDVPLITRVSDDPAARFREVGRQNE